MRWVLGKWPRTDRGHRRWVLAGALLLCGASAALLGGQLWRLAKAQLAERMIAEAFAAHLADGRAHLPWSWADMHPIARLDVPRLDLRRFVLSGGSGTSMAFGIGHIDGTARPNRPGQCVLVGHRDSWCAFLEALRVGDRCDLRTHAGCRSYEVVETRIVRARELRLQNDPLTTELVLLTCYPFRGWLRGPWRYLVICRERDPVPLQAGSRRTHGEEREEGSVGAHDQVDRDRQPDGDLEQRGEHLADHRAPSRWHARSQLAQAVPFDQYRAERGADEGADQ
ncbi:MAG: sortase [Candidatus Eisenbacteria bacterium]|nr:sortase [Candidatus Eisenbacteria bacterium]